jgi:uncharacterized membrane protein
VADPKSSQKDIDENKLMAVLGYIGILLLIPLLAKKDSPYAQFHAKQGLVLLIAYIISGIVMAIPVIGWIVGALAMLGCFILWIMGIVNAISGKMNELPVIGKYAKNFNF